MDLAGFQKPLFGTPDITPQPSPASILVVIFVKPKIASSKPSRTLEKFPVNKR
jgi:hypothetical protein